MDRSRVGGGAGERGGCRCRGVGEEGDVIVIIKS